MFPLYALLASRMRLTLAVSAVVAGPALALDRPTGPCSWLKERPEQAPRGKSVEPRLGASASGDAAGSERSARAPVLQVLARAPAPPPPAAAVVASPPAALAAAAPPPFYRGTSLSYRNTVSALSFNQAAEPTYNPYYAMQLAFSPKVWFGEKVYARGSVDVSGELTQADWTTDRAVLGDVGLGGGVDGLYTLPWAEVDVSVDAGVSLPTSKGTQASTRILGAGASLSLARKLGKKLSVSYSGSAEKFWNGYTTGAPTSYLVGVCQETLGSGCIDRVVQSGRRNADWATTHTLGASFKATPWLSFSAGGGVGLSFLPPLADDTRISLRTPKTSDQRFLMIASVGASAKATDELSVNFGARAVNAQLAPDGTFRAPLVNRFTQLYLELGLNIASLVSRLRS